VPRLRQELTASIERLPVDCDAVAIAFTEAASNVILHAYPGTSGQLRLVATWGRDELTVSVSDTGIGARGFNRPGLHPGLGLGLHIIQGVADRVVIAHRGVGTTVHIAFDARRPRTS